MTCYWIRFYIIMRSYIRKLVKKCHQYIYIYMCPPIYMHNSLSEYTFIKILRLLTLKVKPIKEIQIVGFVESMEYIECPIKISIRLVRIFNWCSYLKYFLSCTVPKLTHWLPCDLTILYRLYTIPCDILYCSRIYNTIRRRMSHDYIVANKAIQ